MWNKIHLGWNSLCLPFSTSSTAVQDNLNESIGPSISVSNLKKNNVKPSIKKKILNQLTETHVKISNKHFHLAL